MNTFKKRRLATIDIGSNSMLMVIGERDETGRLRVLKEMNLVPRLGQGVRQNKNISEEALHRTQEALSKFVAEAKRFEVESIHATLTSAAREASNQEMVMTRLKEVGDVTLEIITPYEEARLTYISVTFERGHEDPSMVVDIGGGSTEVTWGIGARFDGGRSLDLGIVKLIEGPLQSECPTDADLAEARKEIDQQLRRITPLANLKHYYGTAGSFTHLASLEKEIASYHPDAVSGFRVTPTLCEKWISRLQSMPHEEKKTLPGMDPSRADVILPGTLIIERLFKKFGNSSFEVHDRGVRYGKLFDRLRNFIPPIEFSNL